MLSFLQQYIFSISQYFNLFRSFNVATRCKDYYLRIYHLIGCVRHETEKQGNCILALSPNNWLLYTYTLLLINYTTNTSCNITTLPTFLLGCIDVDNTEFVYKELKRGTENLMLANELHLLYLATPLENVKDVRLNWMPYYQKVFSILFFQGFSCTQRFLLLLIVIFAYTKKRIQIYIFVLK